jgi:SNF2 family DNA or RNA helicase
MFHGLVHSYRLVLHPGDYPSTTRTMREVNMYPLQKLRYKDFISQLLTPTLKTMMDEGIISNALNPFLVRTRAISNTIGKFHLEGEEDRYEQSEKFIGIRDLILDGPKPVVVYSFFLSNGVIPMKEFIDTTTELKTDLITGKTNTDEVSRIISDYNSHRLDVLFITSTVRQGITLLRTRALHIMEPSWNESMLSQIIGRVVRFRSHADLPEEERHVDIYSWITLYKKNFTSTDQYIYNLAERKQKLIDVFDKALLIE